MLRLVLSVSTFLEVVQAQLRYQSNLLLREGAKTTSLSAPDAAKGASRLSSSGAAALGVIAGGIRS